MTVHLVGAGPGDPDLITRKGLRLIRTCDVLLHDTLVADELIAEAPASALIISRATMTQPQINQALTRLGSTGLEVVRLKGGDPFVYARGGEEALALAQAGIPYQVVPGVSSISAVPASADIPVTHRGTSDTVVIASGHAADGSEPDYRALASTGGTIVLFMALARLPNISAGLINAGLDPTTPAAVISNGTLPTQQTAIATLGELPDAAAGLPSPALTIVGHVVDIARTLRAPEPALAART